MLPAPPPPSGSSVVAAGRPPRGRRAFFVRPPGNLSPRAAESRGTSARRAGHCRSTVAGSQSKDLFRLTQTAAEGKHTHTHTGDGKGSWSSLGRHPSRTPGDWSAHTVHAPWLPHRRQPRGMHAARGTGRSDEASLEGRFFCPAAAGLATGIGPRTVLQPAGCPAESEGACRLPWHVAAWSTQLFAGFRCMMCLCCSEARLVHGAVHAASEGACRLPWHVAAWSMHLFTGSRCMVCLGNSEARLVHCAEHAVASPGVQLPGVLLAWRRRSCRLAFGKLRLPDVRLPFPPAAGPHGATSAVCALVASRRDSSVRPLGVGQNRSSWARDGSRRGGRCASP